MMRSSKALGPGVIAFIDHLICIVPAFSYTDGLHIVHLLRHLEPWITGLFASILCFVCSPCPERVPVSFTIGAFHVHIMMLWSFLLPPTLFLNVTLL